MLHNCFECQAVQSQCSCNSLEVTWVLLNQCCAFMIIGSYEDLIQLPEQEKICPVVQGDNISWCTIFRALVAFISQDTQKSQKGTYPK